ncbi:hypothetical protein DOTSEDRAFT_28919 [Dothistroma septosporum NZE10]|uniref:Uncharacterized protein n=1 Tax=Dothistroma septosporum (strain NZE10 / CBS 128990) TaxID=675120 RepID=M2YIG4_DOTSN|nr:hypothetical protein DOTSEDRAFT_28919 [Dothistroma septosporum NZE10]
MSSESSNATSSSTSTGVNSIDFSDLTINTSPGTHITEPDESVNIPTNLESRETLVFLGLSDFRAEDIWKRWKALTATQMQNIDSIKFAKAALKERVAYDRSDVGSPDVDWAPELRKTGANEGLVRAIAGQHARYDGVRLTKSGREWIDCAMDWRWEWLLHINKASTARAMAGIPVTPSRSPIQVRMQTGDMQMGKEDYTEYTYDRGSNKVSGPDGKEPTFVPLWRGVTRLQAEHMWSGNMRTGTFSIDSMQDPPATDFSGRRSVQYWTPDLDGAKIYANYSKQIASPAGVALVRIEVPRDVLPKPLFLRYPNENWQRLIFCSRRGKDPEPRELSRQIAKASLLVGDTCSRFNSVYQGMSSWTEVKEKHTMKLPDGEIMTQYVFGHIMGDELEEAIDKLEHRTTIHHHEHPIIVYAPMDIVGLADKEA